MSDNDLTPNNKKKLVRISEAAEILGVSIDTVRRWDKKGKLHSERPNGKDRFFSIEELERVKFAKALSSSEAAEQLNLSVDTLRRLEEKGVITPERSSTGDRLYTEPILRAFLDSEYFMRQKQVQEQVLEPLHDRQHEEQLAKLVETAKEEIAEEKKTESTTRTKTPFTSPLSGGTKTTEPPVVAPTNYQLPTTNYSLFQKQGIHLR